MRANSYLDTNTTIAGDYCQGLCSDGFKENPWYIREAWGDWLSTLADWDWFVTMTLRDPISQGTWTKPGWASAKRAWIEFQNLARPALGELTWVRMFEMTKDRGVPHIHGLVGNTDPSVRRMDLVDWAWRRWGIARVLEYDPKLGARFYLCKYLTKDVADIDFGGLTNQ